MTTELDEDRVLDIKDLNGRVSYFAEERNKFDE